MHNQDKSSYFVDQHGVLAKAVQMSMDVRMHFKIEGVFEYYGVDNRNPFQARAGFMLGFTLVKYRKFEKQ